MLSIFFCQAEDGIRDAQESRGLGDVYKRQLKDYEALTAEEKGIVTAARKLKEASGFKV